MVIESAKTVSKVDHSELSQNQTTSSISYVPSFYSTHGVSVIIWQELGINIIGEDKMTCVVCARIKVQI